MGYFKAQFVHPALESPNILIFNYSIPESVAEVYSGATEDAEVEDTVLAMFIDVMVEEDVVEGDMVITHMNSPSGIEHPWKKHVCNL